MLKYAKITTKDKLILFIILGILHCTICYAYEGSIQGEDYVIFSRGYLRPVLPTTIPRDNELTSTLYLFAAWEEFEPVSFSIHAKKNLKNVNIEITALRNIRGNVFPIENIDLRRVKYLTKRKSWFRCPGPDSSELVPEVLMRFKPLDINENQSQQYWLIFRSPKNIEPGNYSGEIIINPENAAEKRISLTIQVLPIQLREPENKIHCIYFGGKAKEYYNSPDLKQVLVDLKFHGVKRVVIDAPNLEQNINGKFILSRTNGISMLEVNSKFFGIRDIHYHIVKLPLLPKVFCSLLTIVLKILQYYCQFVRNISQ